MEIGCGGIYISDYLAPDTSLYYCQRGIAYLKMKKQELAYADFTKSIELKPWFGDPYYYRVSWMIHWAKLTLHQRFTEAITLNLGNEKFIRPRQGQFAKADYALPSMIIPLAHRLQKQDVVLQRGICYANTGSYELAVKDLRRPFPAIRMTKPHIFTGPCQRKTEKRQ